MSFILLDKSQYQELKAKYRPECLVAYDHGKEMGFSKVESLHIAIASASSTTSSRVHYRLEGVDELIPEASLSFDDDCPVWLEKDYEIVPAKVLSRSVRNFARIKGRPPRPSKTSYRVEEVGDQAICHDNIASEKIIFRKQASSSHQHTNTSPNSTSLLHPLHLPYTYEACIPIAESMQEDANEVFDHDVKLDILHRFKIDFMELLGSSQRDLFAQDTFISLAANSDLEQASLHLQERMFDEEKMQLITSSSSPLIKRQRMANRRHHGHNAAAQATPSSFQSESVMIPSFIVNEQKSNVNLRNIARKVRLLLEDTISCVVLSVINHTKHGVRILLLSPNNQKLAQSIDIIRKMVLALSPPKLVYRIYHYWAADKKIRLEHMEYRPENFTIAVKHQLVPGGAQVYGCVIQAMNSAPLKGLPSERKLQRLGKQYGCQVSTDPNQERRYLFVSGETIQKVEDLCARLRTQLIGENDLPNLGRRTNSREIDTSRLKTADIPIPEWTGTLINAFFNRKQVLQDECSCVVNRLTDENGIPIIRILVLEHSSLRRALERLEEIFIELFENESSLWQNRLLHHLECSLSSRNKNQIVQKRRAGTGHREVVWMAVIELDKSDSRELDVVQGSSNQIPRILREKFSARFGAESKNLRIGGTVTENQDEQPALTSGFSERTLFVPLADIPDEYYSNDFILTNLDNGRSFFGLPGGSMGVSADLSHAKIDDFRWQLQFVACPDGVPRSQDRCRYIRHAETGLHLHATPGSPGQVLLTEYSNNPRVWYFGDQELRYHCGFDPNPPCWTVGFFVNSELSSQVRIQPSGDSATTILYGTPQFTPIRDAVWRMFSAPPRPILPQEVLDEAKEPDSRFGPFNDPVVIRNFVSGRS